MLQTEKLCAGYGRTEIVNAASFSIAEGEITSIIGPNGCGKSTLLKTVEGHLPLMGGRICIDGQEIADYSMKSLARKLGCLNQSNLSPSDMTVERLVQYGRVPYKRFGLSVDAEKDRLAVERAMSATGVERYRDRLLTSLSGGERQKVWIALALAQEPDYLLLDEPTTYLDICHQMEVLELLKHLNEEHHITVVMVLHELNQAIKYSDQIIMMCSGRIIQAGPPEQVITRESIRDVFSLNCDILRDHANNMIIAPTGFAEGHVPGHTVKVCPGA